MSDVGSAIFVALYYTFGMFFMLRILIFFVYDFYLHICKSNVCLVHLKSEDCARHTGFGVTDGCELPHGHWELNLGPLEK